MRFAIAVLIVGLLAHFMVARWALRTFPKCAKHRRMTIAIVMAFALFAPLARLLSRWTHGALAPLYALAATEYLAVVFSVLPITVVAIAVDLASRLRKKPDSVPTGMTRRQVVEAATGGLVLAGSNTILGYGSFRARHQFAVEEVAVRVVGLPRALDGYTIAQISDLHVGAAVQEREIEEGLSRLRDVRADLVVVTGDLVDFDPAYIPMMARAIGSIRARDGVSAILGNHDYYTGAEQIVSALRAAGVNMLVNQAAIVQNAFALLGVDDWWSPRYGAPGARLDLAEATIPSYLPRILLSHQPNTVGLWAGRVALQLSGHTHGGQINPGFSPARWVTQYVAGRYEVRGTTLWVNRGFGVAGPPSRVNAPPEVTKIVLVAA